MFSKILWIISIILVIIGSLNWGLVAMNPDYNLVEKISFKNKTLERFIYSVVGLAGIALVFMMIYYKLHSPSDIECNRWRNSIIDKWNKKCSGRKTLNTPQQWQ